MGRRHIAPHVRTAADELEAMLGITNGKAKKKKRRASTVTKAQIQDYLDAVEAKMTEQDWQDFSPSLVVALYMWCHQQVYGVPCIDLKTPKLFCRARMMAAKQRVDIFEDDTDKQLRFMKWVWRREKGTEKWRREENSGNGAAPIGWYKQFVGLALVTQYQVDAARKQQDGIH